MNEAAQASLLQAYGGLLRHARRRGVAMNECTDHTCGFHSLLRGSAESLEDYLARMRNVFQRAVREQPSIAQSKRRKGHRKATS